MLDFARLPGIVNRHKTSPRRSGCSVSINTSWQQNSRPRSRAEVFICIPLVNTPPLHLRLFFMRWPWDPRWLAPQFVGELVRYQLEQRDGRWHLQFDFDHQALEQLHQIQKYTLLYPPQGGKGPNRVATVLSKQTLTRQ